ncbi:MAG: hypothetical protein ABIK98_12475 [Pseudomonadota bacterium]|uniref:Uncharacterized protein n=1 Tax=Candidatus Desulfatibia profunda TaxID=2841695 RepID=A0A8J6TKK1_9BACT|nr:hypothetical protein [Candidatus Desulfatibia profunda]MBL7180698.1 hypothetical protein [Desulfobacterales bacterium]
MITITSYLHRNRLKDLIRRWMYDEPQPSDAQDISRLVHFNNTFVARYLPVFSELMFSKLHDAPLQTQKCRLKGDLKDFIVTNVPNRNPRVDEMLESYRATPGIYYRETPFHGTLYFTGRPANPRYIGSNRIKRVRRLSEKSARRIIDWIYANIKRRADRLAQERAQQLKIPIEALITAPDHMVAEFLKAENRLLEDLRNRSPIHDADDLVINDVAGIKVIVEDADRERFLNKIHETASCEVIEVEPHTGKYNAVNLIVKYCPNRERLSACPLGERLTRLMQARGLGPDEALHQFRQFVLTGEEQVHVEVIVCDYVEMLESEIGGCMHEDRILRQRLDQQYTGQLARNIEFLMAYLFAFPASRRTELGDLPIRLWNRYLPDYFDEVLKVLFEIPSIEILD